MQACATQDLASKSYIASCFKQVKHLQNLSVKNWESQELKYTKNQ